jgi:DNA-directed RNA polymerase sigma subunit (sigma70/sigma32)
MRQAAKKTGPLDDEAQKKVLEHLHLVELLAREQYHLCLGTAPLEELIGEAQLALTYTAACFDAGYQVPFGAFATLVIRRWLIQAVTVWRRGGRLDHVTFSELPLPPEADYPIFDPICHRTREPADELADRELVDCVRRVLPGRWFSLMELVYVLDNTLEEAGRQAGVSRQRIKQLLIKACDRVRLFYPDELEEE